MLRSQDWLVLTPGSLKLPSGPRAVMFVFPPPSSVESPPRPTAGRTPSVPPPATGPSAPCRGCRPGRCPAASATVGRDEHPLGAGKTSCPHILPPAADARCGEVCRVVVDADTHPALVVRDIVDPVGNRLAQLLVLKVVNPDFLWLPWRCQSCPWAAATWPTASGRTTSRREKS